MSSVGFSADDFGRSNLLQLTEEYFERTSARAAHARLSRVRAAKTLAPQRTLAHLLRDHREESVHLRRDVQNRDAFDSLLSYASILELASLAGLIDVQALAPDFSADLAWGLNQAAVRRYYREFYPLVLPRAFQLRLDGWPSVDRPSAVGAQLFPFFLDVSSKVERDENVETLLWFLDDGSWDGYDITSLESLTRRPKEFLRRLAADPDEDDDRLTDAVDGLRTFLAFCVEFDALLAQCEADPVVQSAFWHYHAYWFSHLSKHLGDRMAAIVDGLSSWPGARLSSLQEPAEIKPILARLTSGQFDAPFRDLVDSAERLSRFIKGGEFLEIDVVEEDGEDEDDDNDDHQFQSLSE